MTERVLSLADVELCVSTFGSTSDPTVLLIAGGGQSMVWWEDGFCARIAAADRHVVRYDHRDTGRSTQSPSGRPAYQARDLATDPLRILDALDVQRAHLVGLSLGSGIAQYLAAAHPDRVITLTLIATTVADPTIPTDELPGPEPRVAATFTDPAPEPDWRDRDAVVAYRAELERPYAGSLGYDGARMRELATREVDRTPDMAASVTNHFLLESDWPADARLATVAAPTLVLHGTDDPLFPIQHGAAVAAAIPGATLVPLPGMGHQQPPPQLWELAISAIGDHMARG